MLFHRYRDRLDTCVLQVGRFRLTWTRKPFAYSLYAFGRRLCLKPIDYSKADA